MKNKKNRKEESKIQTSGRQMDTGMDRKKRKKKKEKNPKKRNEAAQQTSSGKPLGGFPWKFVLRSKPARKEVSSKK